MEEQARGVCADKLSNVRSVSVVMSRKVLIVCVCVCVS